MYHAYADQYYLEMLMPIAIVWAAVSIILLLIFVIMMYVYDHTSKKKKD